MQTKLWLKFSIIVSLYMLTQWSVSLYLPAQPTLVKFFGSNQEILGITLSICFFGYSLGQIFWGTISDYYGRRKPLLFSLFFYVLTVGLLSLSSTFAVFIVLIFILGLIAAAYTGIGDALLRDLFGKEKVKHAIAYAGIAMALAPTVAPLMGSYLLIKFGWRSIFLFLLSLALLNLFCLWKWLPETIQYLPDNAGKKAIYSKANFRYVLSNTQYLAYIILLGLVFGVFFAYMGAAPFIFMTQLHYSMVEFSWILFFTMSIYLLGAIVNSAILKKYSISKMVVGGTLISLIGTVLFLLLVLLNLSHSLVILLPLSLLMFGVGIVLPSSKAGAMSIFEKYHGTAAAVMKFSQTIFCVLITAVTSQFRGDDSILWLASWLMLIISLGLVVFLFLLRR